MAKNTYLPIYILHLMPQESLQYVYTMHPLQSLINIHLLGLLATILSKTLVSLK